MSHTCNDPACPRDLEAGADECSRCGHTAASINLAELDPLTGRFAARPELILGQRFRLIRKLGVGGMGEVWLADDLRLKLQVACKVLKSELAGDERALMALHDEVALTRSLRHPNIVVMYDIHHLDSFQFISMDYVDGESLASALTRRLKEKQGPFGLAALQAGLRGAASALDYAHKAGIYHRDVKPGNLLLGRDGVLMVADFGIARVASDSITRHSTGQLTPGTLVYMSPEQEMDEPLSPASDQYSLAVSVYELLSGKPPFHTGNITAQRQLKPVPALVGLPEHVNAALLKALSKEPEKRFESCTAFVEALAQPAKPKPKPAPPVQKAPEAPRPSAVKTEAISAPEKKAPVTVSRARRRGPLAAVGVCLLLVLVIGFYATRPETPPHDGWVPPTEPSPAPPVTPEPESSPMDEPSPPPETSGQPTAGTERSFEIAPGETMAFVWIPAGTFTMGSPETEEDRFDDEGPQHRVTISRGFWLGKHEVTQVEWEAVMGSNPSSFEGAKNPVESVSWEDCQEFLQKASGGARGVFRLPTEAEWEYACRAGTTTAYSFGDDESALGEHGWYFDNSGSNTHLVGQKKPNLWGLYDMHGNVWERCSDRYGDYGQSPTTDPMGPSGGEYRVLRGGSWTVDARRCRSVNRSNDTPGYRYSNIGFRVARTAD